MSGAARVAFVVAVAENGVIGRKGALPWRMPSDLKMFRKLTLGKPVIMGRKTFQSIGKPLPGRDNLVVTRDPAFKADGVEVFASVDAAMVHAQTRAAVCGVDEIAVIGGADIFKAMLPCADRIYLTRIHGVPEGDTFFAPDMVNWREVSRIQLERMPGDDYDATLTVLERTGACDREIRHIS
ncbi:MAG: dihydrofolate reductase [Sphingomonadales bacterium]|nr:dihydrofolate reductase [Sphingomonadales bacterium]